MIHAGAQKGDVNQLVREHGKVNVPTQLFAYGAAIGIVDLVDVVEMNESLEANSWANGPWCWILKNARIFDTPVPLRGQLGLFGITGSDADAVGEQVKKAQPRQVPKEYAEFLGLTKGRRENLRSIAPLGTSIVNDTTTPFVAAIWR